MSQDLATKAKEILRRYPTGRGRSALLPLLHLVQDRDGYVTEQGMRDVAQILGITPAEVNSVATFYSMYHLRPKGRHVISVCHNIACSLAGAERLIASFEENLGTAAGQMSADGDVTLERVECLAACDLAPMIQIDYDQMSGPIRIEEVPKILKDLKRAQEDLPAWPEVVPRHREVASQPAIESEPGGTSSPETASHAYPAPAPSPFTSVTEMAQPPPVTSAPVLKPHDDELQVISPEPIEVAKEQFPGTASVDEQELETELPEAGQVVPVASDDDFVREEAEMEVDEPEAAEEEVADEPPPLIDSIALGEEDEELLRESSARRGQERRKYAAERLLEEPTYEGGVGPGPSDPRDLGAPLPPPSDEPEPPIRPRGAE